MGCGRSGPHSDAPRHRGLGLGGLDHGHALGIAVEHIDKDGGHTIGEGVGVGQTHSMRLGMLTRDLERGRERDMIGVAGGERREFSEHAKGTHEIGTGSRILTI